MISDCELAGDDLPDELELKSHRLKNVVRKCIAEYMNKEMISNQWIPNVLDVTDALKVSLSGKKINGFVQRFEVIKNTIIYVYLRFFKLNIFVI